MHCRLLRDCVNGIGGMNHFMLPRSSGGEWAGVSSAARYGNFAMEILVNEILKRGCRRQHLEAKVFGGARMGNGSQDVLEVGANNIRFVEEYLATERIAVAAWDVGGSVSRKVHFRPRRGAVSVKKLATLKNQTLTQRESAYRQRLADTPVENTVELF